VCAAQLAHKKRHFYVHALCRLRLQAVRAQGKSMKHIMRARHGDGRVIAHINV
jgi:hypothetical protein